ncbi:hypothetical protein BC834DRAFT_360256 [Gloeopeniophorella convolvens]|nr:hypothetical protein BC834DRAFT_360256 [Gloeopeniophorella convolvens]
MAHYDIFREELGLKYHGYGYALWEPSPGSLYTSVEVGDVGFIREGKFHRIFNILLPGDHPSHRNFHVPEDDEPLELKMENHIDTGSLSPNDLLSGSVIVASGGLGVAITSGSAQVSFTCSRKRGAVLSLPVHAQRQDTVARGDFGAWMVKHIDKWFAFMQDLGLGVDRMEDVVLVTGRHLTKSWANTTFSEGQADAKVSLGVQLDAVAGVNIAWNFSRKDICGAMLNIGPSGEGLPEDQCIFIRGLRASRVLKILPTRLRGAAQQALLFPHPFPPPPPPPLSYPPPSPSPPSLPRLLYSPRPHPRIGESDRRASIVPTIPPYQEPLHVLMEYIAEHAFGCDMVLVHDDDLDLVLRQCEIFLGRAFPCQRPCDPTSWSASLRSRKAALGRTNHIPRMIKSTRYIATTIEPRCTLESKPLTHHIITIQSILRPQSQRPRCPRDYLIHLPVFLNSQPARLLELITRMFSPAPSPS